MAGKLYLCGTPIGNLEDMTFRAVRILKEVSLIAAEDTRHTQKLLNHFDIHTPLISYHEHNRQKRGEELRNKLLQGEDIALVSDAGMPGVSDPGVDLVRLAVENNIVVVPIPGANAALSALVCSGMDTTRFLFVGFLSRVKKKRRETLKELATRTDTMIFYEAPHRALESLKEIQKEMGNRQGVIGRELTKVHEEFIRGDIDELIAKCEERPPRGEFTIVVAGKGFEDDEAACSDEVFTLLDGVSRVRAKMAAGMGKKDAIRQVAAECKLVKRELYQECIWDSEQEDG